MIQTDQAFIFKVSPNHQIMNALGFELICFFVFKMMFKDVMLANFRFVFELKVKKTSFTESLNVIYKNNFLHDIPICKIDLPPLGPTFLGRLVLITSRPGERST